MHTRRTSRAAARSFAYKKTSWRKGKKAEAFSSFSPPSPRRVDGEPRGNTTVITNTIAKQKQRRWDTTVNAVFRRSTDSRRGEYRPFSRQFSTTQSAAFSPGVIVTRTRRPAVDGKRFGIDLTFVTFNPGARGSGIAAAAAARTSDRRSYSCSAVYNVCVCVCVLCARARQTGGTTLSSVGRSSLAIKHGRHARARDVRRTMVPHRLAASEVSTTRHRRRRRRRRSSGRDESAGGGDVYTRPFRFVFYSGEGRRPASVASSVRASRRTAATVRRSRSARFEPFSPGPPGIEIGSGTVVESAMRPLRVLSTTVVGDIVIRPTTTTAEGRLTITLKTIFFRTQKTVLLNNTICTMNTVICNLILCFFFFCEQKTKPSFNIYLNNSLLLLNCLAWKIEKITKKKNIYYFNDNFLFSHDRIWFGFVNNFIEVNLNWPLNVQNC